MNIQASTSDSITDIFEHIDKIERAVLKKEQFVKELFTGILQSSGKINTKAATELLETPIAQWVQQKTNDGFFKKETNIHLVSLQLTTSISGNLLLWLFGLIPSSQLRWKMKYALASIVCDFVTSKQLPAIQSEIRKSVKQIEKLVSPPKESPRKR